MYTFKVSFYDYELWGYNYSSITWSQYQSDKIAPQSFHITSDVEVTVYAHEQAVTTSDAMLVLPADVLGTEYFVMSYNSDGRPALGLNSRTPSQFAVVATEDSTIVKITTKISSWSFLPGTRTVKLNKGNSYLVQARFDVGDENPDLTGTYIQSDKPVAVFGGHQRSTIPVTTTTAGPSRDCLLEQLPPVSTWGKNAYVVPPKEPSDPSSITGSLFRVLACSDSTQIKINGVNRAMIKAGEFYWETITSPKEIESNNPILIGIFKYTAGNSGATFPLGDPFMMLIPPKEQFLRTCRVNNIQSWEKNQGDNLYYKVYLEQHITIVAETDATDSIYVDGVQVMPTEFSTINTGTYSFAHISVDDGVHSVSSREPVGVYIYGYGRANSYGYIGGMDFRKINYEPPVISIQDSCFKVRGRVQTSNEVLKLTNVEHLVDSTDNVTVKIDEYLKKSQTDFLVDLINNRFDGKTIIKATDSAGRSSEKNIEIQGLTLSSIGKGYSDSIPRINIMANPDVRKTVYLWNYGKYPLQIRDIRLKLGGVGRVISFPAQINSGTKDSTIIDFFVADDTLHYDTLIAETKCGNITLAYIRISRSACDAAAFEYPTFENVKGLALNGRTFLMDKYLRLTDADRYRIGTVWYDETVPVLDGFSTEFKFRFTSGNNFQCEDGSEPGADGIAFVIQNAGKAAIGYAGGGLGYEGMRNSLAIEFDTYSNDSTQIEQYFDPNGNHVAVNSNGINENTSKHFPHVTLGIRKLNFTIRTDSTFYYAKIVYSLKDSNLIVYLDTNKNTTNEVLRINNFKIGNYLELDRGYRAYVGFTSATGCAVENHDIYSWSFCPAHPNPATDNSEAIPENQSTVNIIPNPFNSTSRIFFNSDKVQNVSIDIIDLLGFEIKTLHKGMLNKGIHEFSWTPQGIDRGMYFVRISGQGYKLFNKIVFTY
jgi:hypothetical protein